MNRIIFVLLLLFLALPSFGAPEPSAAINEPAPIVNAINQDGQTDNLQDSTSMDSISTEPVSSSIEQNSAKAPYNKAGDIKQVVPETKGELIRVGKMFLKTMFLVILCSILMYFILLFVKKIYSNNSAEAQNKDEESSTLKSAQNENEALKAFFNQTKNH